MVYINAFLLLNRPPVVSGASVELGRVADGYVEVPQFPATVDLGVFVEIAIDQGDWGHFDFQLRAAIVAAGSDAPDANRERTFHQARLMVGEPEPGWWQPSVQRIVIPQLRITVDDEADAVLSVWMDDEFLGERVLWFRDPTRGIPPGLV